MDIRRTIFLCGGVGVLLFILAGRIGSTGAKGCELWAPALAALLLSAAVWCVVWVLSKKQKLANVVAGSLFLLLGVLVLAATLLDKDAITNTMKRFKTEVKTAQLETKSTAPATVVDAPEEDMDKEVEAAPVQESAPAQAVAPQSTPASVTVQAEPIAEPVTIANQLESRLGLGDPFQYSHAGWESYLPTQNNQAASGIIVKGIIRLKGQEPLAILHLSDSKKSFYVGKGDVIRIPPKSSGNIGMGETYLQVKDIRDHEVEIIQQERPDRVIIVR